MTDRFDEWLSDLEFPVSDLGGYLDRTLTAVQRGVTAFIRQSSEQQRRRNLGSGEIQLLQREHIRMLGVDPDTIPVIDARGETGKPGVPRPQFERLVRMASEGEIGLVILARHDRLGRNTDGTHELLREMARNKVLLMVDGRVFDPSNREDMLMLRIHAALAEFDNQQRTAHMALTRCARARRLAFPIPLPTGLVWASPSDPLYRKALETANLGAHLEPESLELHKEKYERNGRAYYVLPYPDADVHTAVHLLLGWYLESGDPKEVIRRVNDDPIWPRPGKVPSTRGHIYQQDHPHAWVRVGLPTAGRSSHEQRLLRELLESPGLFGVYRFRSKALLEHSRLGAHLGGYVYVPNAFPAFGGEEELSRVRALAELRPKGWRGPRWLGTRNHYLDQVRCADHLVDGKPCGRKMSVVYKATGIHRYLSPVCCPRGHAEGAPARIDEIVKRAVLEVFGKEQIAAALTDVRRVRDRAMEQSSKLREEVNRLEARMESAAQLAVEARTVRDLSEEAMYKAEAKRLRTELRRKNEDLDQLRVDESTFRELQERKLSALLELARDLPMLLRRADGHAGKVRQILREFVSTVHSRRLGRGVFLIEVEFISGARVRRIEFEEVTETSQPMRVLAHLRLGELQRLDHEVCTAESIASVRSAAAELAVKVRVQVGDKFRGRQLDALRLAAAALQHAFIETEQPRIGEHETVAELAHRTGVSEADVLTAALEGKLGPAKVVGADLALSPTDEELHRTFPTFAQREIAIASGWSIEDTVPLRSVERELGGGTRVQNSERRREAEPVKDAAGFWWIRRSAMLERPLTVDAYLDSVADQEPEIAALDRRYWAPLTATQKRLGLSPGAINERIPRIYPGFGDAGCSSVWVCLTAERDLAQRAWAAGGGGGELPGSLVRGLRAPVGSAARASATGGVPIDGHAGDVCKAVAPQASLGA